MYIDWDDSTSDRATPMQTFNIDEISQLLARLNSVTAKLRAYAPHVHDPAELQALSQLNNRAALYLVDFSSLLQEETLPVSDGMTALVDMAEVFCREVEALPDPT